jgi:hypothetical protein
MKPWPPDVAGANSAARRERRLAAIDRAQRTNRRRFVARHTGAEQTGNGDRRDDPDDRHDDQQFDKCETLVVAHLLHHFYLTP